MAPSRRPFLPSPPIMLKTKGGKPFSALANLLDEDSLHVTWKVSNRVAAYLEQGHRMENLSWRLWHLRDVMSEGGGALDEDERDRASSSRQTLDDVQQSFSTFARSLAARLESDRKRSIEQLEAPEFRWTNGNDALRHRALVRTKRRDARAQYASLLKQEWTPPILEQRSEDRRTSRLRQPKGSRRSPSSSSSTSSSTSSSSPNLSRANMAAAAARQKRVEKVGKATASSSSSSSSASASKSPPVCWRLTHQQGQQAAAAARFIEKTPKQLRSTWTLQEIEDAERELTEQGVELSGPLMAMLADLKTGFIKKVHKTSDDASAAAAAAQEDDEDDEDEDASMQDGLVSEKAAMNVDADADAFKKDEEKRARPQCVNCGATSTPLWRRDANFDLQCNACGLYEKLHKAPRPKALKQRRGERKSRMSTTATNVISSEHTGGGGGAQQGSISPQSGSSRGDEWIGIHSGATCANCGTSTTPLWRKDREGRIICNACGLYYKLHNAHRPVTMRMDAIKRRSRYDDRRRFGSQSGPSAMHDKNNGRSEEMARLGSDLIMNDNATTAAAVMMLQRQQQQLPESVVNSPGTPIGNPFNVHNASTMPLQPLTSFNNVNNDANSTAAAIAGADSIQQNHHHMSQSHSHTHIAHPHPHPHPPLPPHPHHLHHQHTVQSMDGIHIPSSLWEQQVCPMGAWGENCCQNLPQPSIDIQSALLAAGASSNADDQAAVSAAMDALLHHNDWLFAGNPAPASSEQHAHLTVPLGGGGGGGEAREEGLVQQPHFDAAAITGLTTNSAVGPSFPLKRRKMSSTKRRPEDVAHPNTPYERNTPSAAAPSPTSSVTQRNAASTTNAGASNANTPTGGDWWPFAASPGGLK